MAHLHSLAGQFAKGKARDLSRKAFVFVLAVVLACICAAGFAWGYFWSMWGQVFGLVALVLFTGPILYIMRWADRQFDAGAKERIKYMRGGQAEAYVAWLIKDEFDDRWHIFNGVKLERESDTDHVLVGPGGVFCISTKSHRGWFVGQPAGANDGLLWNNKPCPFARDALRQASSLAERLRAMLGVETAWVQAVLAVPFGYVDHDACGGRVWLVYAETVVERLLATERGPRTLNAKQIERVVKAMEMITADAANVYQRPTTAPASVT